MNIRLRHLAAAGLLLGASHAALAAGESAPKSRSTDEVVQLDPFRVSTEKDTGYIASDTLSSSRLNTQLLLTPSDVSVLTRDFLDDIATFNLADAEPYLTNSAPAAPAAGGLTFGADVSFRGLPSSPNTRNYFNAGSSTVPQYIVERVEGQRGANSILYGPNLIGGSVNILTKQANFLRDRASLTIRTDNFGSKLAMVDANRRFKDKLAIRVNAVAQDQKSWMACYRDKMEGADVAVTYRPWPGAEIRVEGEETLRRTQFVPNYFIDQVSQWNGTPITGKLTGGAPGGSGISKITTDYLVVSPSWGGNTVYNFNGFGRSAGTGLSVLNDLTGRPHTATIVNYPVASVKSFRNQPSDAYISMRSQVFQINFTQRLPGDGIMELAAYRADTPAQYHGFNFSNTYVDVNQVLPDGTTNPEFGKLYNEVGVGNMGPYNQYRTDYRAAIAYPLKTQWFTQNVSFIADQWCQTFDPILYAYGRNDNPTTPKINTAANQLVIRRYWDGNVDTPMGIPPPTGTAYNFGWVQTRNTYNYSTLHGYSLNTSGAYFHDTLNVVGGIRRDFWSASDREINTSTLAPSGAPTSFTYTTPRALVTTRSIGGVYFPEKYVGVYAQYQEGFNPTIPSYPTLTGQMLAALTSDRGRSVGLRFRLLDGRVVGSVGYYDAHESGRTQAISNTYINDIWTKLATIPGQSALGNNILASGAYAFYLDTYDYRAKGYEADITANLSAELRLTFNAAFPQTEQANSIPTTIAYYNANLPQWQALLPSLPAGATQTAVNNDIANIQSQITSATNGRTVNGTYKWRSNAFAVYEFHRGALKGFKFGGGANFYGKQQIGNVSNQAFDYIYTPAYATYSALAGYATKVGGHAVTLQVNVNNLLNYDRPIFSSVGVLAANLGGGDYRNAYYYSAPRTFVLSASFTW